MGIISIDQIKSATDSDNKLIRMWEIKFSGKKPIYFVEQSVEGKNLFIPLLTTTVENKANKLFYYLTKGD